MKHVNTSSSMNEFKAINFDHLNFIDSNKMAEPYLALVDLLNPICKLTGERHLQKPSISSLENITSLASEIRMYCVDKGIFPYYIPDRYCEGVSELNELERVYLYRELTWGDVSEEFIKYS